MFVLHNVCSSKVKAKLPSVRIFDYWRLLLLRALVSYHPVIYLHTNFFVHAVEECAFIS